MNTTEAKYQGFLPQATPETAPFWKGCREGRLLMPRCKTCNSWIWYPRPFCIACESWDIEWQEADKGGTLYSFSIIHRPAKGWETRSPYVLAMVDLDAGPRLTATLDIGTMPTPENVRVGMRVKLDFDAVTPEVSLPLFRPEAS